MKFLRYFFSYVPPDPFPEVPKDEPPDPNADRILPDHVRHARRNLVVVCGLCLAWSSAQFSIADPKVDVAGVSIDLKVASIPVVLAILILYLTVRWAIEFALMPRNMRRWPMAQLDFRMVLFIARLSVLAVAAGSLDRSLWTFALLLAALGLLAVVSAVLGRLLASLTMRVRIWARQRAKRRVSVANAAVEAAFWARLFGVVIAVVGVTGLGIASYQCAPLRNLIWPQPPNPFALGIFVFVLIVVFLSQWLLRPLTTRLFAERPGYYTERNEEGYLVVHHTGRQQKEPLL